MFELAKKLLEENNLCDNCLGRQFALVGYGLSNCERGLIIKNALVLEFLEKFSKDVEIPTILANLVKTNNSLAIQTLTRHNRLDEINSDQEFICELCDGLFAQLNKHVNRVLAKLENEDYSSFLIGAKITPGLLDREDTLRAKYQITTGESLKSEFTRELGKKIMTITNKEPTFTLPDITVIVDLVKNKIILEKRSLFIYGRYNKFIRTIPQTKWPCYDCKGKGCKKCNFTGKQYQESVEELVAEPFLELTKSKRSKFHGAGREDINALMLGNGRPFVLEMLEPKIRKIDLKKAVKLVNRRNRKKVKISEVSFADKKKAQELKDQAAKTQKTYRAIIELDKDIAENKLMQLETIFSDYRIKQRTPQRVLHRRANLVRNKTVYKIKVRALDKKHFETEIIGEGGLYIKELISGDNGRTIPSFAEILECQAICTELDVIYLHTATE